MRPSKHRVQIVHLCVFGVFLCATLLAGSLARTLEVTATAYNSTPVQTNREPWIGAWGDRLRHDTRAIAVSRDLIEKGLGRNVEVSIEGLPGRYRVLDTMGRRWARRIDVYMGTDVEAAREWGVREVQIRW